MNENPEQLARDEIDRQLIASRWIVQKKIAVNLRAGLGVAVANILQQLVLLIMYCLLMQNLLAL
jgi:hypothetical protein